LKCKENNSLNDQNVKVSYDVYVFTAFMQCNLMDKMSEHMMGIQ